MKSRIMLRAIKTPLLLAIGLLAHSGTPLAQDIEIYQSSFNSLSMGRPKVLIVVDDSGSMGTGVDNQRPRYDDHESYTGGFDTDRVYWAARDPVTGKAPLPGVNTKHWFEAANNRCAESFDGLDNQGFFQTAGARRWDPDTGKWKAIRNNDGSTKNPNPPHVECQEDILNSNSSNGSAGNGYPKNKVPDGQEYSATTPADSDVKWGSKSYTFFTGHYLNYKSDDSILTTIPRITIAQDVITSIISTNTGIDFGLMEFNGGWTNPTANGGRVLRRIIENMTISDRSNVVNLVNQMEAGGSTPMCESVYEAYRYLAGETVLWGADRDTTRNSWDEIPRDTAAESPLGTYDSPSNDCAFTYIILVTDGLPQSDESANTRIETLTGKTCSEYPFANQGNRKNCLPELAEYMATNDLDNDPTNDEQFAVTYTIGFTTDQQLLSDTAEAGGGDYFTANSADDLTAAFQGAILGILSTESTFTSPAVAVDTFTRTRSRNDVFYAMFKPTETLDWPGNIKKLKLTVPTDPNDPAVLVDANGVAAIDPGTGNFKADASTFWSTADGGVVTEGGVGALLAARNLSTRNIKSNTGSLGALEDFSSANMTYDAFGFANDAELFDFFDVADQAELDAELASGRGYEINKNGSISTVSREWILADILHSKPLVINYGALGSFTKANPDLRFVVGTNAGFLHMFGNDNGEEDWAFFPKELAPILRPRRLDIKTTDHVYGIDLPPVVYTKDNNHDGTIDSSDGDKAWIYFGLRRGGRAVYGLDVSNPNVPAYLWGINSDTSGFSEMGQTWSIPVITRIPGYRDGSGVPKPVLIFGAGYDTNKDSGGLATADSMGRGIYIVDAETGALVWSVTPGPNSATNLNEATLEHSVPGQLTVLDSNGDELTDRIYFGDTGGHVWRVDLSDGSLPTGSQDTWKITKLADLNEGTVATDRRFFNAPDVVRVRANSVPIDVVLIGSGDRSNPNSTDVSDRFYMLRDKAIKAYTTDAPTAAQCSATPPILDYRCELPIVDSDLFDITSNVLITGTAAQKTAAVAALAGAKGWRLGGSQMTGEKSLSKSITINGRVFFTTFTPSAGLTNVSACSPQAGLGLLYILDLYSGDRSSINLGPILPDTPSVHFGEDGKIRLLLPPGAPTEPNNQNDTCAGGVCDLGEVFRAPYGTYWYQEEY